ncbi:phage major tail tube protein [Paenibacillus sp. FSL R5-808]|uniref:phage major tail tube protein n=1 Tax=unclassified Paenibacillus TaxID=185978 RepID=UPI0003E2AC45|nr:phage major tail tube protein [Paenibacillus sp. FSL R5-808]ETT32132.1 major tail tube protein [Paenibacillus sp. FSL R5-808]
MAGKQIPDRLTNFTGFRNGSEYLGVVDVDLPDLESLTETISGAGIPGEFESPLIGHFGSMVTTLNWRVLDRANFKLARQEMQQIDFRGSIQTLDATQNYIHIPVRVTIRGMPKTTPLGSLAVGGTMDNSNELETYYIKIVYNGETVVEIDKTNFICIIDGVDYLAQIRENLGL